MIFILRNHKILTLAVAGLILAVLMSCAGLPQLFGTVFALEYTPAEVQEQDTAEDSGETAVIRQTNLAPEEATPSPYGLYEKLSQEQRNAYVAQQKARQETLQLRLYVLYNGETGLLNEDSRQDAVSALTLSLQQVARLEAMQSRSLAPEAPVWHNPLVLDTYVTSPYGMRWHPVYQYYRMHYGVDLNAYYGDEIRATRAGIVVDTGWDQYYGYYVIIDHGDGFESEYFHMTRYLVSDGQYVEACELIGLVGSTGTSTGAHLHFGLLYQGEYVDPADYVDFRS